MMPVSVQSAFTVFVFMPYSGRELSAFKNMLKVV